MSSADGGLRLFVYIPKKEVHHRLPELIIEFRSTESIYRPTSTAEDDLQSASD